MASAGGFGRNNMGEMELSLPRGLSVSLDMELDAQRGVTVRNEPAPPAPRNQPARSPPACCGVTTAR